MLVEQFAYKGFTFEQLKKMDMSEFIKLIPSRQRRSMKRGFTEQEKKLFEKIKKASVHVAAGKIVKPIKTHCRSMLVIPIMVGITIGVYDGRQFVNVDITPDKLGHYLGEFTYNRKRVAHSSPGVGATRGSTFVPIK